MYSQHNEEKHILRAVQHVHNGRFLDIGAWNAKKFSNTRALYERGWSGVMIEPSPEPFIGLLKEYGQEERITLIHAAIGFDRNCQRMYASADGVSTASETVYAIWKDATTYDGRFWTPTLTIPELTLQFGGGFEFVNFDAEGFSVPIFEQYIALGHRPICVCVEHDGLVDECRRIAAAGGLSEVEFNGTNLVFAR